ncbi:uncharacterized protein [Haliotis cracherodii]|uniref:uncharacterized protein n=1 Tax=Haliotis cracherodii TaxID=6455 RepID=UPI0039E7B761
MRIFSLQTDDSTLEMTTNRAPAEHLNYGDHEKGDIIMIDVQVPKDGSKVDTYYSGLNWNAGHDGGGYCGIQDHGPKGRTYIFSMWDPKTTTTEKITAAYQGLWTKSHHFGHEGSGLHSDNTSLGWDPDVWFTLAVRRWDVGKHSHFGYWVQNQASRVWTHLVTFDYPIADVTFMSSTSSFMENYSAHGDGSLLRQVHYGHGYKRRLDKTWIPFVNANFSVNQGAQTANWNHNYNAGTKADYFFLELGKTVHPDPGVGTHHSFKLATAMPPKPAKSAITFTISKATHDVVEWHVPETSTPQFSYTIDVDGKHIASGVDPEKRNLDLKQIQGNKVTVTLEDLFGETVSVSKVIT